MLRLLQKWIISTFGFSKSETNGSLILVGLVILTAVLPRLYINNFFYPKVSLAKDSTMLKEWFEASKEAILEVNDFKDEELVTETDLGFNPVSFDPNKVSEEELLAIGFPPNIAKNIISYRNAGGSYQIKSDLQRIYGMSETIYEEIKDFIRLPESKPWQSFKIVTPAITETATTEAVQMININQAEADELQVIRGIGPKLSERIIKYRNLLGGFHAFDQIKEVYGLNEEVLQELNEHIKINDQEIKTIDINSASADELAAHPYIDFRLARIIINYRSIHGPFQKKSDLMEIKIVSDSLFHKLSPYISLRPE